MQVFNSSAWPKRLPRKRRSDAGVRKRSASPPALPVSMIKRPRRLSRPQAAMPALAALPLSEVGDATGRDSARESSNRGGMRVLAARLACGRSWDVLAMLMDTRLFNVSDDQAVKLRAAVVARRGLQAIHDGRDVLILDTFKRRGCLLADVSMLVPGERDVALFRLGAVATVPRISLSSIGLRFRLAAGVSERLVFEQLSCGTEESVFSLVLRGLLCAASSARRDAAPLQQPRAVDSALLSIVPAGTINHRRDTGHHPTPDNSVIHNRGICWIYHSHELWTCGRTGVVCARALAHIGWYRTKTFAGSSQMS
jgi:hypothetical protein